MTGCYAQRVGMHTNPRDGHVLRPVSPYGLHPDELTLAEVLKQQGYATTIVGKWHLGDRPEFLPTRQGFDSFFGIPYSDDMTQAAGQRFADVSGGPAWPPLPLMEDERVIEAPVDRNLLTSRYTTRALDFIAKHKDQPFFLYLAHAMPGQYGKAIREPCVSRSQPQRAWGDAVEELDASTGRILDKLVELGIAESTLVIWTSDNGSPLAADVNLPTRGSNQPLYGRGYTTAEGAFRVPTIVWWPGHVPAATECDQLVTTMDLLPTLALLAGGMPPTGRHLDGHDIRPLLLAEPGVASPYDVFYYYAQDQLQAVRSGPWKLFLPVENPHDIHILNPNKRPCRCCLTSWMMSAPGETWPSNIRTSFSD